MEKLDVEKITNDQEFSVYSEETILNVRVVLKELLSNIIKYSGCTSDIHLVTQFWRKEIHIRIADNGKMFNPLEFPAPDISTLPVKSRENGSYGIYMVRNIAKAMNYYRFGRNNILTLRVDVLRDMPEKDKAFWIKEERSHVDFHSIVNPKRFINI